MTMVDDVIPTTSLVWGEENTTSDNETKALTSTPQDAHAYPLQNNQCMIFFI